MTAVAFDFDVDLFAWRPSPHEHVGRGRRGQLHEPARSALRIGWPDALPAVLDG